MEALRENKIVIVNFYYSCDHGKKLTEPCSECNNICVQSFLISTLE